MGSRGIAQAHTPDWAHWLKYVPIKPATHPSMPDTQLCFPDNCAPLAKNSYVNIRQIHSIHLEALRPYRLSGGDPPVLGKASFKSLKKVSGFIDLYDLTSSDSNTSKRLKRSKNRDVEASLPEFEDLEVDPQETVQSDGAGLLLLVLLAVVFLHLYIKSKA